MPLAFLDRDFVISEALISYVEVPKIALLRTLAAIIAVLWLIEWGIHGRIIASAALGLLFGALGMLLGGPQYLTVLFGISALLLCALGVSFSGAAPRWQVNEWFGEAKNWLRERPSRWLLLAVWFFLGSTLLSTVLSESFNVSAWGEVPGQDGYPAYTVVAYVAIFAVIATHVKTKAQMWRLMGAIVTMGTLVSAYSVLQHYGHDFLNLIEQSGGGTSEVSVFMGNSLFAGAALMMVVPMTLVVATLAVGDGQWTAAWSRKSLRPLMPSLAIVGLLLAALTVQLLGITFTFARGPWVGMIVALVGALGMMAFFAGWRTFLRAAVISGLTVVFGVAMLHGLGSIAILGIGPWLGAVIALVGFLALPLIYADQRAFGRAVLGIGLAIALTVAVVLAISWFKDDSVTGNVESGPSTASTAGEVAERLSSIREDVLSGFASGRATHWRASWRLIKDRPWFGFDTLGLPWLRYIVGYGPDLFRYTYLLESPSEGPERVPLEPDHAHNFFIHQTVEQGVLGLLSALGLFVAALFAGGYLLFKGRGEYTLFHKLILIGLVATLVGRLLEMMVGVARVSDMIILWVLLAALAALPETTKGQSGVTEEALPRSSRRRRNRPQLEESASARISIQRPLWRVGIIVSLILLIGILTWVKGINNVRAAVQVGNAVESFRQSDYKAALADLDRAIELAPDVSVYYNHKAAVFFAYQLSPSIPPEAECSSRDDLRYDVCLAVKAHQSNLEGSERRPFYYRSRFALANTAYNLRLDEDATQYYEEVLDLVPDSWKVRDELADVYVEIGRFEDALKLTTESIAITEDRKDSAQAYFLRGRAFSELGEWGKSLASLERGLVLGFSEDSALQAAQILGSSLQRDLKLGFSKESALQATELLAATYASLEQLELAAEVFFQVGQAHWNRVTVEETTGVIEAGHQEPQVGTSNRESTETKVTVSTRSVDGVVKTVDLLGRSIELGLSGDSRLKAHQILAEAYISLGEFALAGEWLYSLGGAYQEQDRLDEAARAFEDSLEVTTSSAMARQARKALVKVYTSLGRFDDAEEQRIRTGP